MTTNQTTNFFEEQRASCASQMQQCEQNVADRETAYHERVKCLNDYDAQATFLMKQLCNNGQEATEIISEPSPDCAFGDVKITVSDNDVLLTRAFPGSDMTGMRCASFETTCSTVLSGETDSTFITEGNSCSFVY